MPKVQLRRGFSTEVNQWGRDLRDEMGIARQEPLCPFDLARYLKIPVFPATGLTLDEATRRYLVSGKGRREISAGVFYVGLKARIVLNDAVGEKRLASDLAHEISHVLLRHKPLEIYRPDGQRLYDKVSEEEASKLGPGLLVSEEAALRAYEMIESGIHTHDSLSDQWKVTPQVIRMRINLVGAKYRIAV